MVAHSGRTLEPPSHLRALDYPNVREMTITEEEYRETSRPTLGRAVFLLEVIRLFEQWLVEHSDLVHGPLHSSIGQEAVAVGMALALRPTDQVTATHRAHHHVLAKLLTYYAPDFDALGSGDLPEPMVTAARRTLAEILGLAEGLGGGRGGSMHLADFEAGIATTAIVGGGIPIGSGLGLASRLRGSSDVALAAFGDGASSIGAFHEGLSLARAWNLPVIFLAENNMYSVATTVRETTGFDELAIRASGYDMPAIIVDGMDPLAVRAAIRSARERALSDGPVFVEARTYRWYHHSGPLPGSAFRYRTKDEEKTWAERDSVAAFPRRLVSAGLLEQGEVDLVIDRAGSLLSRCTDAVTAAKPGGGVRIPEAHYPAIRTQRDGMIGPGLPELPDAVLDPTGDEGAPEITYGAAISGAIANALEKDPEAYVVGLEVGHFGGGAFGATKGAVASHPDRVLSAPICENGFVGAALGTALLGLHPIVEIMYPDFSLEAADQLFNHAAKARYMYGGQHPVPMVVRTLTARGRGFGPQHSSDPASLFGLFPGWRITAPSTAAEYVGLFNAALLCRDPVLVIEDPRLLKVTAPLPHAGFDYVIPFNCARVVRRGSDVTVLAWSYGLSRVLPIAEQLADRGISVEVIDPRWLDITGFDRETVVESVGRTGSLVIVEDAMRSHSVGGQIVDRLLPELFPSLRAAPLRVTGEDVYMPVSEPLETAALLRDEEIEKAIVAAARAASRAGR